VIVSNHMTRLIANLRKQSLERLQLRAGAGDQRARAKLDQLGVPVEVALVVVPEPHRRLKWAVRAVV
jgi:hypothetical protein